MGFSESLGVVISMKDAHSPEDEQFDRWLRHNIKNRCFEQAIPRATALQTAAYFSRTAALVTGRSIRGRRAKILRGLARRAAGAAGGGGGAPAAGAAPPGDRGTGRSGRASAS